MTDRIHVSLILPIRNESRYIKRCLLSILDQDFQGEMEILIADGMSTDNTEEIVQSVMASNPGSNISVFDNSHQIVSPGMNLLIPKTLGDIVIRIDGHCEIETTFVNNCVRELAKPDVWGVGGPIETIGENFISEVIAIAMSSKFGVGGSAFRTIQDQELFVDTVAFPAYRREVFEQVGLFDEELIRNQDDEFNFRIRKAGGKILLSPEVRSKYYSRGSLSKLFRQYYQYGYWKVRVLQKHPRQMSPRQFVPPIFVLTLVVSLILTFLPPVRFIGVVIPVLYLLANIGFSLRTALVRGWKYFFMLPVVFATLHLSYGLGFIIGLFKFWNRWGDKVGKVPKLNFPGE